MDQEELELKEKIKALKQEELKRRKQSLTERNNLVADKKQESSAVYISNLPILDDLHEKLIEEFSKFGIIAKDQHGNPKCKLYKDEQNKLKGDALIIYARHESVAVAIELMDGYNFHGVRIKVEVATFDGRKKRDRDDSSNDTENDDQSHERPTKLLRSTPSQKRIQEKEESIHLDDQPELLMRTAIISNISGLMDAEDEDVLEDIKMDILHGCEEIGSVESIQWNTDEAEASVLFQQVQDARRCCDRLNGRLFDGKKLLVYMSEEQLEESSNLENDFFTEDDLIEL